MIWLLVFILEFVFFSYADKRLWGTFFTPFHFLAVPYSVVLIFTVTVSGRFGISDYYYPSIMPWVAGLPLFCFGSWIMAVVARRKAVRKLCSSRSSDWGGTKTDSQVLLCITGAFLILLYINFISVLVAAPKDCVLGSDCFGERLMNNRVMSHTTVAVMALLIIHIFDWNKNAGGREILCRTLLVFFSVVLLFFLQVKSWLILPVIAAVTARVSAGKTAVKWRTVLITATVCVSVFFLSYLFIFRSGTELFPKGTPVGKQFSAISRHCVHYFISGTTGLALDMQNGISETPDLKYIFAPFVNVCRLFGGKEFISCENPYYFFNGLSYTNVRTFFGTLYVYGGPVFFCLLSFFAGCISYALLLCKRIWKNKLCTILYAWLCTVLFIGWFNLYIQLSTTWEIPMWIMIFYGVLYFRRKEAAV